jgi:hypothetical protein
MIEQETTYVLIIMLGERQLRSMFSNNMLTLTT